MEIKEKLKETGHRFSEAATGLKDKLVAKLSEENAQTPEQRLENARAAEAGAKEAEKAAKRALMAVQDEADKYKRYAEMSEKKGDSAGVRKFENALAELAEKLRPLEEDYQEAAAKTAVLGEICAEYEAALNAASAEAAPQETVGAECPAVDLNNEILAEPRIDGPEVQPEIAPAPETADLN